MNAPGRGDGYIYGPLSGPQAAIIRNILQRSVDHPEIQQHDIQALIWAILARTKINQLSHGLQVVAAKLLTPQEIYQVNGGALGLVPESVREKAYANLPPLVRQTLEAEARLREMLTQGTSSYEELEKVAVRFGDAPRGEGSRDVPEGRWSYYPDGYFVRYLPTDYPQTRITVYLPEPFTVERDNLGRIARLADAEGNRIEATYDDTIEPLDMSSSQGYRGYAFKSVKLVRPYPAKPRQAQQAEWENLGWALVKASGTTPPAASGAPRPAPERYDDWQGRSRQAREWEKQIAKLRPQPSPGGNAESSFGVALDLLSFEKGIEVAAGAGAPAKPEWFTAQLERVFSAVQFELCLGAGGCATGPAKWGALHNGAYGELMSSSLLLGPVTGPLPAGPLLAGPPILGLRAWNDLRDSADAQNAGGAPPALKEFDPSGQVAVPGNTARQRLSQSGRPENPPCDKIAELEQYIQDKKHTRDLINQLQSKAKDCDELAKLVTNQLQIENPGGKVQEGGHFDPSEGGNPQGECVDECKIFGPPVCEWMNQACKDHEKQHSDDWQACQGWPSGCAKDQQNMAKYCAGLEDKGYTKEIESLENALKNLKQACAR